MLSMSYHGDMRKYSIIVSTASGRDRSQSSDRNRTAANTKPKCEPTTRWMPRTTQLVKSEYPNYLTKRRIIFRFGKGRCCSGHEYGECSSAVPRHALYHILVRHAKTDEPVAVGTPLQMFSWLWAGKAPIAAALQPTASPELAAAVSPQRPPARNPSSVISGLLSVCGSRLGSMLELEDCIHLLATTRATATDSTLRQAVLRGCVWNCGVRRRIRSRFWLACSGNSAETATGAAEAVEMAISEWNASFKSGLDCDSSFDSAVGEQSSMKDIAGEIQRDVGRTFPTHEWLAGPQGQTCLYSTLRAVSLLRPAVGYCQGENFVAASVLLVMAGADGGSFPGEALALPAAEETSSGLDPVTKTNTSACWAPWSSMALDGSVLRHRRPLADATPRGLPQTEALHPRRAISTFPSPRAAQGIAVGGASPQLRDAAGRAGAEAAPSRAAADFGAPATLDALGEPERRTQRRARVLAPGGASWAPDMGTLQRAQPFAVAAQPSALDASSDLEAANATAVTHQERVAAGGPSSAPIAPGDGGRALDASLVRAVEQAATVLVALIDRNGCAAIWAPDLSGLSLVTHQLQGVTRACGRRGAVLARMAEHGFQPGLQAAQWLIPLLATVLPPHTLAHVMDAMLLDGWPALFKVLVAATDGLGRAGEAIGLAGCMKVVRGWRAACTHETEARVRNAVVDPGRPFAAAPQLWAAAERAAMVEAANRHAAKHNAAAMLPEQASPFSALFVTVRDVMDPLLATQSREAIWRESQRDSVSGASMAPSSATSAGGPVGDGGGAIVPFWRTYSCSDLFNAASTLPISEAVLRTLERQYAVACLKALASQSAAGTAALQGSLPQPLLAPQTAVPPAILFSNTQAVPRRLTGCAPACPTLPRPLLARLAAHSQGACQYQLEASRVRARKVSLPPPDSTRPAAQNAGPTASSAQQRDSPFQFSAMMLSGGSTLSDGATRRRDSFAVAARAAASRSQEAAQAAPVWTAPAFGTAHLHPGAAEDADGVFTDVASFPWRESNGASSAVPSDQDDTRQTVPPAQEALEAVQLCLTGGLPSQAVADSWAWRQRDETMPGVTAAGDSGGSSSRPDRGRAVLRAAPAVASPAMRRQRYGPSNSRGSERGAEAADAPACPTGVGGSSEDQVQAIAGALPAPSLPRLQKLQADLARLSGPAARDARVIVSKLRALATAWPAAESQYMSTHVEQQEAKSALESLLARRGEVTRKLLGAMQIDAPSTGEAAQQDSGVLTAQDVTRASSAISALDSDVRVASARWQVAVWRHTMADTRLEELSQARAALQDQLLTLETASVAAQEAAILVAWREQCALAIREATAARM